MSAPNFSETLNLIEQAAQNEDYAAILKIINDSREKAASEKAASEKAAAEKITGTDLYHTKLGQCKVEWAARAAVLGVDNEFTVKIFKPIWVEWKKQNKKESHEYKELEKAAKKRKAEQNTKKKKKEEEQNKKKNEEEQNKKKNEEEQNKKNKKKGGFSVGEVVIKVKNCRAGEHVLVTELDGDKLGGKYTKDGKKCRKSKSTNFGKDV